MSRRENLKQGFAFVEFMLLIATTIVIASVLGVYLVTHSKSAKLIPMFVKTISNVNQAVLMTKAQHDFDFQDTETPCPQDIKLAKAQDPENDHTFCAIFNSTMKSAVFRGKVSDMKYYANGIVLSYVLYDRDVLPPDYRNYLAYTLKDGTIVAFNKNAVACSIDSVSKRDIGDIFEYDSKNPLSNCVGFIDVNGTEPPNKEITCKKGDNSVMDSDDGCEVDMRERHMRDVFPVVFYNSTVEPATAAGKYIMANKKN